MRQTNKSPADARGRPVPLWHKIRAVLIAGIVLGVGATGTLAAQTNSIYATGTVGSGSFVVEGNSRHPAGQIGSVWGAYPTPTSPAVFACLDWATGEPYADTAVNIPAGGSAYCAISLRTKAANAPPVAANVTMSGASYTANPLTNIMTYTVRRIVPPRDRNYCSPAFWSTLDPMDGFPSDAPLSQGSTQPIVVPVNSPDNADNYVHLCLQITVPANAPAEALGIGTGYVTWHFTAIPEYS